MTEYTAETDLAGTEQVLAAAGCIRTGRPYVAVGLLGLGEVGRIYGAALVAAGHRVTGFDPYAQDPPRGVELTES
ncbi:MAG: hypothetical protein ABIR34_04800, partial [Marmoricola sp.]